MIISPLMAPIMAGGMSFATGDYYLGKKALKAIALGVFLGIAFAAVIALLSPLVENTQEIIARTKPNILDLFIAFFCGLAGAFSITFKKVSGSIVGVAISVALMPPLCVTGIGISTGQIHVVIGSFFLFFTNLTAIFISSTLFFLVSGFFNYNNQVSNRQNIYHKYLLSFGVLLILSLPLMYTLKVAVNNKILNDKINNLLVENFNISSRRSVESWKISDGKIFAKINTISYIPQEQIDTIGAKINSVTGKELSLEVAQIPIFSSNSEDKQAITNVLLNAFTEGVSAPKKADEDQQKDYSLSTKLNLKDLKELYPDIDITDYNLGYDSSNNFKYITLTFNTNKNVTLKQINTVINYIKAIDDKISVKVMAANIYVEPVYFAQEKYNLEEKELQKLSSLAEFLNSQKQYLIIISGYADSTGNSYFNQYISEKRTETVKDYMYKKNILPDRININSYGESISNQEIEFEAGRQSQRRVDFKLILSHDAPVLDAALGNVVKGIQEHENNASS